MIAIYSQLPIKINGSGIQTDSTRISTNYSYSDIGAIGYQNLAVVKTSPTNSSAQISYYPYIGDPILNLISQRKTEITGRPVLFDGGGISGMGYIKSCSINFAVGAPSKADVSLDFYNQISGDLTGVANNSIINRTGIFDPIEVTINKNGETFNNFFDNIQYSINFNLTPIYSILTEQLRQIHLSNITEDLSVRLESGAYDFINSQYSLEKLLFATDNNPITLNIQDLAIDLSGFKNVSMDNSIDVGRYGETSYKLRKVT